MPKIPRRNNDASSLSSSHVYAGSRGEFSPPPSRIPWMKWQEIIEDECVSHIIGSIREEIIRSAEDAIYEGYLRRKVYGFVVNCAHEAWMRAFQWAHLPYDDEGIPDDWSPDDETPSPVAKSARVSRVPTIYGRYEKLITIQKSSSYCKAPCAKGASRRKNERIK
ncbi:uncharacterized protein LOC126855950 [Cataglyphis hispanica]|uniref:uncharacterized protein LOC126855950 n=1 Tax=Cataglyphis hispanica TaxID=1086592 RepID=UPI00217FFB21|nr:uncharacterized protein LOC126855950 [Cataglyphis hispanica]